jgi:colanic acid biosynthesis glycosyl transferase WcaI
MCSAGRSSFVSREGGTRAVSGRLAFVTQWFPPEPAVQPLWIAKALERTGWKVSVLTGVPNYPNGQVVPGYSPSQLHSEVLDELSVIRVPLYPSHDRSAVRRFLNYASWACSSALFGQSLLRRSHVTLVYASPATAALPAMVARLLWGTPYVLHVQDVWPDSIFSSGFLNHRCVMTLVQPLVNRFVRLSYKFAQHIVVISPGMRDMLIRRGVPEGKISVVYNWLPDEEVGAATVPSPPTRDLRAELGLNTDDFVLMYAGNHGKAQALDALVDAFTRELRREHLLLVGDGVEKPQLKERAGSCSRVHFLDPVPRSEVAELMNAADAQAVVLADRPLFAVTMPSKLQSILASAHPALVVARGDAADIVVDAGAGVAATPEDSRAIANAVRQLASVGTTELRGMGERGLRIYQERMTEEIGRSALAAALGKAAASRRRRSNKAKSTRSSR